MIKLFLITLLTIIGGMHHSLVDGQLVSACVGVPFDNFVNSPRSCAHFYLCRDELAISEGACTPGHRFHPISQYCDFEDNVNCEQCSPFGIQHIPIEGSCTRYIRCDHGTPSHEQCQPGLHFSRDTGWCENPTDCEEAEETTTEVPTTEPQPPITVPPPPITPSTESPLPPQPPPSLEHAPDCQPITQVFHAHPHDCRFFFMCMDGQPIAGACSNGLIWNQFTNNCDTIENTVCITLDNFTDISSLLIALEKIVQNPI